jgi:hypothetical protein
MGASTPEEVVIIVRPFVLFHISLRRAVKTGDTDKLRIGSDRHPVLL